MWKRTKISLKSISICIIELKNNSIFGVYEEIYDVEENDDFIYVYSNLVSYNAIYKFDLKNEDSVYSIFPYFRNCLSVDLSLFRID